MNLDRDKLIKGVVIGILALIALGLLANLFGGQGVNTAPGYYGHGGEGAYGNTGGSGLTGLLNNILSLLVTLFSVALVVFLGIGAYKAAAPYLNTELAGFLKSAPKNKCAKCEKELSAGWQLCPYCGSSTGTPQEPAPQSVPQQVPEQLSPHDEQEVPAEPADDSTVETPTITEEKTAEKPVNKLTPKKTDKKKKR